MGLANYISSSTASGSGGFTHSVSNPGNNNFAWLNDSHIEIRLSTAGQTLGSFTIAIGEGTINKLTSGYTLIGSTLTFSGLTNGGGYHFEVKRVTPHLTHYVDFQAGSPITETDLDNSNLYALYRTQELEDGVSEVTSFSLTLEEMKSVAGITGAFVGNTDTQNIENKTFATDKGNFYDCGGRSWTE